MLIMVFIFVFIFSNKKVYFNEFDIQQLSINLPEFTQLTYSTYELTKQFVQICVKNCAIDLKKNNLYPSLFFQYLGIDNSALPLTAFTVERHIGIAIPSNQNQLARLRMCKLILI